VEFLLEGAGDEARFYFLEMNTRLQVEHPVTEAVVGVDLVQLQLAIAGGHSLPWTQEALSQRGHAIECRVYAEDPDNGFLPQAGRLLLYREPDGPGVRVDSGVVEGGEVTVHYDPMLAKLIAHAPTRAAAIARAATALKQFPILGVRTNIPFLLRLLDHWAFASADVDTGFIDREIESLLPGDHAHGELAVAAACVVGGARGTWRSGEGARARPDPWRELTGWRN
jgi:acetyl/propionyl-CoA carboxylase alpha subunit